MHSSMIVGYMYRADLYCPHCIVTAMAKHDNRYAQAETPTWDVEADLDVIAHEQGIDRYDEHTFDSGDFPKVVFADQTDTNDRCGSCHGWLI